MYVVNTMWGRLDHILGNINSLYSRKMAFDSVYMLSETSIAMVVDKVNPYIPSCFRLSPSPVILLSFTIPNFSPSL